MTRSKIVFPEEIAGEADKKLGEEVCANAYITKPVEPGLLISKIKELIK